MRVAFGSCYLPLTVTEPLEVAPSAVLLMLEPIFFLLGHSGTGERGSECRPGGFATAFLSSSSQAYLNETEECLVCLQEKSVLLTSVPANVTGSNFESFREYIEQEADSPWNRGAVGERLPRELGEVEIKPREERSLLHSEP